MASRASHTWQMILEPHVSSLMHWPSQKPISRKRWVTFGESGNCLIRTDDPPRTRLSGMADESWCSGCSDEVEMVADCMLATDDTSQTNSDYTRFGIF